MTLAVRRVGVVAVVLAVLVALGVLDASVGRAGAPRALAPSAVQSATADAVVPAGAGTSAWFCAGGSGAALGVEATVVVTDPTDQAATGTVEAITSDGTRRTTPIEVPAGGVTSVVPAHLAPGPWVSAMVLLDVAGVAVDETVSSAVGWSEAPCASAPASHWLFVGQSTSGNDGVALSVLNPSVTPAVVDIALTTSNGQRLLPAAYQGITVPPTSLVVVSLADHDEDDPSIATEVTAVTGTVVATELESAPTSGEQGVSLTLGVTAPSHRWELPASEEVPKGQVVFHFFDPSRRPASVRMDLALTGATVEPVVVHVPAGGQTTLDASSVAQVPAGVPVAATVVATGAPIIVSRSVRAPAAGPDPHVGLVDATTAATQWVVPPVTAPGTVAYELVVEDAGSRPVTVDAVSVAAGGSTSPVPGLSGVQVAPTAPLVVAPPPAPAGSAPLLVTASGPIAVQLDPEPVGAPGVVTVPPLPIG